MRRLCWQQRQSWQWSLLWYEDFVDNEDNLDNEVYLWYEDFLEDEDVFVNEDCIEEEGYLEDENCPCKDVCPLISCSGAILAYENIITLFIYPFLKKKKKFFVSQIDFIDKNIFVFNEAFVSQKTSLLRLCSLSTKPSYHRRLCCQDCLHCQQSLRITEDFVVKIVFVFKEVFVSQIDFVVKIVFVFKIVVKITVLVATWFEEQNKLLQVLRSATKSS